MPPGGPDRLAYLASPMAATPDEDDMTIGDKLLGCLGAGVRPARQYSRRLPGGAVGRPAAAFRNVTAKQAVQRGVAFAGNTDTVYRQVTDFYDKVGGFEPLILMGRRGSMTDEEVEKAPAWSRRRCCRGSRN